MGVLTAFLVVILLIGLVVIFFIIADKVFAQNSTPAPVTPVPTIAPTPTQTTPNFQYLPQKAYVQPFAPESGVPQNSQPLTAVPQVVPVQNIPQQNTGGFDLGSMAGIIGLLGAGGAYLKGHFANKKAEGAVDTSRANASAIVDSKAVEAAIAKFAFKANPEEANMLNDAPEIKLQTLEENKKKAVETATNA